ncbi:MAG: S49 family peptidase, partial [Gammaproteobacteria bacterium]|nr:S49 family peptidase [Gammaproteobacteria bacterium]
MTDSNWTGGREVPEQKNENWEREALSKLALAAVTEQRRSRRWSIFFKLLMIGYLFVILFVFMSEKKGESGLGLGNHTALIEIQGVIADNAQANADTIITGLRNAFKDDRTQGVIIRINSPGGSPVQAGYV